MDLLEIPMKITNYQNLNENWKPTKVYIQIQNFRNPYALTNACHQKSLRSLMHLFYEYHSNIWDHDLQKALKAKNV